MAPEEFSFHYVDLANKNHICLRCGAVEPFAASGLTAALLDSLDDFRKRHEDCPILGEACLTGSRDTAQYAVKVSLAEPPNTDGLVTVFEGGKEVDEQDNTRDLAIRTALNGAL